MASSDDLPWNTTRCNRLLRPLSTKLAKLRKELERPRAPHEERRASATAFALKASLRKPNNASQSTRKPRELERCKDPDWMPDTGSRGLGKKTYGGRTRKKPSAISRTDLDDGRHVRPGGIAFTPLVARTGSHFPDSPQLQDSPLKSCSNYRGPLLLKAHIQELKTQMPAQIGTLVKGTSEAYANLLQATSVGDEKTWKGTRSLFSACLRKIPAYIELEQHFAELDKEVDDEDDNTDVSQEVYTHLEENFEAIPGQGWRGFKQVVRAHGTSLLCEALIDQMLGLETLHLLVAHCLNAAAWDEAERFLWSFLPNFKPLPMPNSLVANLFDEQRSLYMWMVKDFVSRTRRYRFLYDQLEYMLSQELVPLEWLATECMRPVWDRLVRSLSDGDTRSSESAFRFLETAICAGIGIPNETIFREGEVDTVARQFKPSSRQDFRDALDTTFSSLLTVFCSIALVNRYRKESAGELTVRRVTWVLDSIVVNLLKRKDIRDGLALLGSLEENVQLFAQRAIWAVFGSFIIHLEGCHLDSNLIPLEIATSGGAIAWVVTQYSSKHIDGSQLLQTLPGFVSAAARGTGRIWKDDGFDQIQRLVQGMLSLSGIRLPHKLWTMKRLALESVMDFAQSTSEPQHVAYARDVEQSMRLKGHIVIAPSPHKNDSPSAVGGFRWEEGIGEWVACTPFAREEVKRVSRKPVPVLQLLPSPAQTDDENTDNDEWRRARATPLNNISPWEALAGDEDADDHSPQSSPIKETVRRTASSLGKRTRASSPMVYIPAKRITMTPPDTPVFFYSEQDLEQGDERPRRSRRSRKEIRAVVSTLRTQRSRSSLDKGLRDIKRTKYEEVKSLDQSLVEPDKSEDESDLNTPFSSSSSVEVRRPALKAARSSSSSGKKVKTFTGKNDLDRSSKAPSLRRRSSRRNIKEPGEWWKANLGAVGIDGDDELSFE